MLKLETNDRASTIWLFGSGTIGHEIHRSLAAKTRLVHDIDIPWSAPEAIDQAMEEGISTPSRSRDHVVWAAGRAGFLGDHEATRKEWLAYEAIVRFSGRLAERSATKVRFHLVSSAGGLYEGQAVSRPDARPLPTRPYGHLKLDQERLALVSPELATTIYRPSSVFAAPRGSNRPGLIGVLAAAAWRKAPARITGKPTTLRDYVAARDVGRHIARTITDRRETGASAEFLVAGVAEPIHLVVRRVEEITRRRLMVEFSNAWNARDITFSGRVKEPTFETDPLTVGIRRVVDAVRSP